MTESMKNRALNVFAAMGDIPDRYVAAAEEALMEAESGNRRALRPAGPFRRFLKSGWGAAVISGIVALTVLFLIIRAGQQPPVHGPNQPPLGSSIAISEEGADFTIATEEDYYPVNTNRITVVMTGVTPGKSISMTNAWYLEWLTDKGAQAVEIYYTEEAAISAKPARGEYATLKKAILINDAKGYALQPGSYRLHATVYNGEEYVSVAWCEFEVAEPEVETLIVSDHQTFRYDPRAVAVPFTVTTVPQLTYGTDQVMLTVTAEEPMVSLFEQPVYWHIQREDGYLHTSVGRWEVTDTSSEAYVKGTDPEEGAYATYTVEISLLAPEDWEPGTYRVYALTEPLGEENVYAASCTFTILGEEETVYPVIEEEISENPIWNIAAMEAYPRAAEQPYTISVPDLPYSTNTIPVTVTAKEPGVSLPTFRNWKIVKLMGTSDPYQATWYYAENPSEPTTVLGYSVCQENLTLYGWNNGIYRIYALNESNEYIDYCDFAYYSDSTPLPFELSWITKDKFTTSRDTHLQVWFQGKKRGERLICSPQWSIYRYESSKEKTLIGTSAVTEFQGLEVGPEEYAVEAMELSIYHATGGQTATLPEGMYELVYHYKTESGDVFDYSLVFSVYDGN